MRIFLILTFFISSSFAADSCEIVSYAHIIKINKVLDDTIIKTSNCSSQINQSFIELISNANGKLQNQAIKQYLKAEKGTTVSLTPVKINVATLIDLVQQKFGSSDRIISKVSSLIGKSALLFNSQEKMDLSCQNCNGNGSKNLKLKTSHKTFWISANFKTKTKAFKVSNSLIRSTPILQTSDFEQVNIVNHNPSVYFQDIKNIKYYRLNKHLQKGDILKTTDLTPKNLITYGQRVKLTILNKNIHLKSVGIAKKNGKIGQYIEIENPTSKKIFLGKVTNYNEATVEL